MKMRCRRDVRPCGRLSQFSRIIIKEWKANVPHIRGTSKPPSKTEIFCLRHRNSLLQIHFSHVIFLQISPLSQLPTGGAHDGSPRISLPFFNPARTATVPSPLPSAPPPPPLRCAHPPLLRRRRPFSPRLPPRTSASSSSPATGGELLPGAWRKGSVWWGEPPPPRPPHRTPRARRTGSLPLGVGAASSPTSAAPQPVHPFLRRHSALARCSSPPSVILDLRGRPRSSPSWFADEAPKLGLSTARRELLLGTHWPRRCRQRGAWTSSL
jgi:hypothetical protein